MTVIEYIITAKQQGKKLFAWLIDPDKPCALSNIQKAETNRQPSMILVGGSSGGCQTEKVVEQIKAKYRVPVLLFPGNVTQVTPRADALLFLSLLSGRNPEMLIGQQVRAAETVRKAGIETIAMGYILVDGGTETAVARVSGTQPMPQDDVDEIVRTAMAGEMMGMQAVYLEAGSGARCPVREEVIRAVRRAVSCPLIVGGGICSEEAMLRAYAAGADIVVVGNYIESHPEMLERFASAVPAVSRVADADDERYMRMALHEAEKALHAGEVPIGCVVVSQGRVIGRGHNLTETLQDVTAHAEMQALTAAAETTGGKYLTDATLYVTVEPCVMCAGAIGWAQVKRVVYGCGDEKRGFGRFAPRALHAKAAVTGGVLEEECRGLVQAFFRSRRCR